MNKIFKVIWCSSSQVWVAVSELSKVKPVSSVSSVKKTSSAVSTLLKTTALAIPFALSPLAAHAYVAIGSTNPAGYAIADTASANPAGTPTQAGTRPLDYFNPGNKSYYNKNSSSGSLDTYGEPLFIDINKRASPIAIGNHSNAMSSDGRASVAVGDYANASDGLGVAIGSYARSDRVGATAIGTASRAGGINSLAMMRQAAANGNYSVAIGSVSWAQGESSFAMGASATAKGDQSIAIGNVLQQSTSASGTTKTKYDGLDNTQSNGVRSVAIGSGAKTNGDDSFAFGSAASTGKFKVERDAYLKDDVTNPDAAGVANKAIAFGTTANATGNASIAFGANSLGAETNSIAFGVEAKARKADAIAFGSNANASEANAIAFGSNAEALHENVITIGKGSKATKKGAMTIGESAQSNANNSLALGNGTIINQADIKNKNAKYTNDGFDIENGVVAIANKGKERRLVNLAAGREDTDAVNVKQLSEVNDNLAKSIAGPNYNGYTVDGNGRYTYKAPDFEIKNQTLHNVKEAVELAQTNYVSVKSTIDPKTAGSNYDNKGAQGAGSIALGESTGTNAAAVDSVAIGHNTKVNGNNTVAIGANITAETNGSVILGDSSKADGSHATETVASKEIDGHTYNFVGKAKDAGRFVSVGEKGNERQIKNVAAGHVEADSTDAINGSQLYAVASRVEQGWKITAAKTGTGEVSGNAEKKVAMGDTVTLTAGDNIKITQNEKNLTVATKENVNFTTVTTGNTTLGDNGLTINNGPSITQDGINAGDKKITNVSNGTISPNSKDAVNGSQLYATNQNVTNNANNIAKGLNFQGDNTDVTVNRQLGETLNINGGADKNNLSDNNIGVVGAGSSSTSNGGLTVKLAKDLKGLNSVETKEIKLGDKNSNTTIKYDGDRIKYGDKTVANLDDEKHIKPSEYTVDNNGDVTMTYVDGNGNDVANEKAVIKGIAKNDLSNINKAGETKIQNLAKDAIDMENGENTVASHRDVNGVKTFKVDVKGDLANITSITGGANTGKVEFAGDQVVNVAGDNPIKLDAKTGDITGLTNKTLDGADFGTKGRAATEEQLKIVNDSKIGDNNIRLAGNSGKTADQKLSKQDGIEFNVVGGDNAKYVTTTASGANVTVDLTQDTKDKIDNAANKDLSNITNEGKKVITGLGTIVEAADSSVTVTNSTDAVGRTTYKVKANVPGSNAFNIKYKANGANDQTVALTEGLDFTDGNFTTASVGANGVVKYDVNLGKIKNGADGKTGVDGNDGLATVKTVVEAINNSGWLANATKSTGELDGTSTATKVKPGAVVNFDAGKNLKVKQTITGDDHTYTYSLDSNLTNLDKVVVNGKDGANGKDGVTITGPNGTKGEDGKVGITGKDGKDAVSIAGKDGVGHIGLTGPKGADGSDGKSIDISTNDGTQTLVNQEPGTDKSQRIVYTPKDKDGNPIKGADGKDIVREIATMDDGLKFKGDDSTVIAKKLNEQLDIIGGADKDKLTDNNIGVNSKDGKLNVQLSKDIDLTNDGSIKFGDNTLNINKDGLTITGGPSVTKTGIDGGNKQIKNVQEGTDDNDVVTVKQLKGSKTIIENGKNTTVTGTGSTADPYKVNVEGALNDISSITNKDGSGKVEFAGDQVVNVAGDNSIKLDAKTGDITGLTNKTIDGSDFATKGRAATEEQLKATGDQITKNLTEKGLDFGAQSGNVIHKNLGEKLEIVGEGTEADDRYDATNIKTMTKDGKVVVGLAKDLTADKVTVGQKGEPGKDGVDGQIGVNGKDGSAVVLNGKDGSIGLNGENGKNGISIKGDQGPAGVDGADGETKNRIVYEYKDPNDPNKTIKEDVATLNDGLKFAGDDGQTDSSKVIAKKLNQQVDIVGGADKDKLTDNNIGVNNDNGKLKVQLAKDVNLTQDGSVTIGDTALNNGGLTITGGPSVTKGGINAGDKQITNVDSGLKKDGTKVALKDAEGDTLNNAVNVGDLKESITNLTNNGFGLTDENGKDVKAKLGETVTVKGDGSVTTKVIEEDGKAKLQVGLNKDVTIGNDKDPGTITVKGENGKDGISINGKDGTIGLKGEDGKDGIALNGKDGTIGINGKDGSNGKITVAQGKAGLDGNDGKDGETKTRIVYEKPNGDKEEVATLNDGLRFKGDKGDSIAKKLNEELEILGKLDPNAAVTDKNLRVDNDAGKLVLKMAKQLQDLTSATFIDETTGNKSVIDGNGLTVTPKDADSTKTVSVTDKGLNNGGNQIVNVDSGLKKDGAKVELKDAQGDTLNNAVNVGDLKESITNLTNNGFGLTDENGKDVKAKLGETVTVKGDGSVTTKVIEEDGKAKLQVGLNKDVTIGNDKEPGTITVKGENGKDGISINGKDGSIGLKGEDGKDGIALNGKDGTIGINGKDGSNGKITVAQGQAGLDGNDGKDGKTKTRIVYEKPNGDKEEVATLNDGLRFTGNNEVENSHKLNSLVTIKGEGVDKAASEKFESAAGNVNVKADGKGTLEVQLAKDLKNIDSISNKDGQKIEFKDGGTTISGGNVSVGGNNITHVKAGEDDTDAVNVKQLKDGIAQATTKVAAGKNVTVEPKKNADGSTTYTVATKDDVDFTSVTTGKTTMNDGGITIKATEGGKTNVTLTNKGLDNGGNKVVNVADGDISATSKDAVNGSQLHNTKVELTNKGLDFGAQSGADIHKNLGEKLEIVGEGTKADDRYDATNIKTMTKDGKVVIGLDKDLKSDSVTVGSVGKDGKPGVDGKVGVNGKDGSSVVINGKDGSIGLTGPKGADGKSPSITVRTENGTTTVNEKDAGKPVERIKYTDSNNNTREVATLDDGLKFTGDDGKTVNRTLGSNLNIKGGAKDATSKDNIRITNDGKNGLKVQLANNVTLDNNGSVNIGGTRVDNNGITTNNGKGPSVTNNGVNAGNQKITNVKDGAVNATSKDAVNGSQLHRAVQNIDNKFGDVYGKMNKINKEARAGIAGANAAAGLPQVYLPGKSMVAASAGTFKGQNALAIGYSRSSDNGKVILKLQGNANTQGDVGGSVGVGYQW